MNAAGILTDLVAALCIPWGDIPREEDSLLHFGFIQHASWFIENLQRRGGFLDRNPNGLGHFGRGGYITFCALQMYRSGIAVVHCIRMVRERSDDRNSPQGREGKQSVILEEHQGFRCRLYGESMVFLAVEIDTARIDIGMVENALPIFFSDDSQHCGIQVL